MIDVSEMKIRVAMVNDIPQLVTIRLSVKENILSNPTLISEKDYNEFLTKRGKGWVGEINNKIVGFAIVDMLHNNVWALFIEPGFEKLGIGRKLHDEMLNWYFSQTNNTLWLGTSPHTRAYAFYHRAGWKEGGLHGKGEVKFEMTNDNWKLLRDK